MRDVAMQGQAAEEDESSDDSEAEEITDLAQIRQVIDGFDEEDEVRRGAWEPLPAAGDVAPEFVHRRCWWQG